MDVICMKHAIPFEKDEDCPICINEKLKEIWDDINERKDRKQWEIKHKKVLGE